jgi:hypothetical protein
MRRQILKNEYIRGADMDRIMGPQMPWGRYIAVTIALLLAVAIVEVYLK